MSSPVATSGRVVFLRFLSQAYHPLRQVPPLAAITSNNELALKPKAKKHTSSTRRHTTSRRGGATLQIREECERFFCETMKTVFQVEGNMAGNGSVLTGVQTPPTPPDDYFTPPSSYSSSVGSHMMMKDGVAGLCGWMEFWDYVGGASFRAFLADDREERSLFAFFDSGLIGRDLKQALIGLIELADPLECSRVVICMERSIPEDDAKALMRSLQWVGFELTTLDHWSGELDTTSNKWLFMGMEV
ncbi:ornithine decarboxylase antizyme [Apiospora arundinis]